MLQPTLETDNKEDEAARAWSISSYLVALAFACTVPIAIVTGVLAFYLLSQASQNTRFAIEQRLQLLRNAVELRIANVIEDLDLLAHSPSMQEGDLKQFNRYAAQVIDVMGGVGLVLVDRQGQHVVNTRLPPGSALPRRSNLETQNRVFETGRPQVSDLVPAAADGAPIISVEVPVRIAGEIRYVLAAGLSPKYLVDVMDQYVPDGMIGSIIDRKGILIARRPVVEGDDLVGRPAIYDLRQRIGEPSAFWIETVSRGGVPYYASLLRSAPTGWSVTLAVPRDAVDGRLRRSAVLFAALTAAALLLSLICARLVTSRFLRALAGLEQRVGALGQGRPLRPALGPVAEVNRMERVLHGVGADIAAAEESIDRERSLLRATVDSMPIGVLLLTPDGTVSLVNRKMLSLWGIAELRSIGDLDKVPRFRLNGTRYPMSEWPITRALRDGQITEDEEVVHEAAGVRRHLVINACPVRDSAERVIAAVAACYDVSEIHAAMTRQQILLDEINHRVKNTLATVQSVARLTLSSSDTLQDYANAFERRLLALSAAYNLLTDNNWEGAELRSIVQRTLAPYSDASRTSLSGPAVTLTPKFTLALAAAIQELSTNAAKYGALSTQTGRVDVSWSLQDDGRIFFTWMERDGPAVTKPTRRGFGTRLIQDILANDTGWTVTLDYLSSGLRCTMVIDPGPGVSVAAPSVGTVSVAGAEAALTPK